MAKKILVIEDDRDIADLVKLVLETTKDFEVQTVLDPLIAYQRAKEFRPEAILLDLTMPKMDGWAVFRLIRSDSSFTDVPIGSNCQSQQSMNGSLHIMNADAYITKPFGKQNL